MSSYELPFIYWKKGDDFNDHLGHTKSVSEALNSWAAQLTAGAEHLQKIAKSLLGVKVSAQGDTHMVCFDPEDNEARIVLQQLVKDDLLEENEDEDDDEDDEEIEKDTGTDK